MPTCRPRKSCRCSARSIRRSTAWVTAARQGEFRLTPRELLQASFRAAVAAADPLEIVPAHLPKPPDGRTLVLAAGKAAASMALAVESHWPADKKLFGIALTRYGHALTLERIRWVEAGHPVPDEAGEQAAREMLGAARAIKSVDLLLTLISGGGSALLSLPVDGVTISDLRAVTRDLLKSGATIQEINTVRKHLSQIQGGRLAAACKAPVVTLIISDVTGDDPTHIASGPCAPDPTTYQDAVDVLNRFDVKPPQAVLKHLIAGLRGEREETPKPGSPVFANVENRVIATARRSLEAAAKLFRDNGIEPVILERFDHRGGEGGRQGDGGHGARDPPRTARPSSRRWRCSRAANAPSRSAAPAGAAGAAANSCSGSASNWRAPRTCTPSPRTPTASTARRTTPAPCSRRTRSRARARRGWTRESTSRPTTATGFFPRSATWWSPAPRAPT